MKCYKCHWLCFTCSGYSDWTVTGEWINCPSGRFKELDKYEDKENEGLIALASKDCPFFKEGTPAETCVDDTDETDNRIEEFEKLYPNTIKGE